MTIEKRINKLEKRVDKIENFISKEGLSKQGKLIECDHCSHTWITRSKMETVSCTSCGQKVKIYIKKNSIVACFSCKKRLKEKEAIFGYNHYFHKDCFKKFDKASRKEVDKMVEGAEKKGSI